MQPSFSGLFVTWAYLQEVVSQIWKQKNIKRLSLAPNDFAGGGDQTQVSHVDFDDCSLCDDAQLSPRVPLNTAPSQRMRSERVINICLDKNLFLWKISLQVNIQRSLQILRRSRKEDCRQTQFLNKTMAFVEFFPEKTSELSKNW